MSFCKRSLTLLCAFAVMALGVFSFSLPSFALAAPTVDVQPFFLSIPQLPDGYFDGDILANGDNYQLSLDFSNLASTSSESGSYSGSSSGFAQSDGNADFSLTVPIYNTHTNDSWSWSSGSIYNEELDGFLIPGSQYGSGSVQLSNPSGVISGNSVSTPSGSGSITGYGPDYGLSGSESGTTSSSGSTDYSGSVSGSMTSSKDTSQHYRYHLFSCVASGFLPDSVKSTFSYYWFIVDARNTFYVSLDSSYGSSFTLNFIGTRYPAFLISFSSTGSRQNFRSLPASFTFYGSSYSSSNESLGYFWFSSSFPPVQNGIPLIREAIFGKETLLFSYLNLLHTDLNTIHSDLTSLSSAMQSAISNQTTTFQNMDAASGFDPTSVDNMLNYGSLESNYHAPSTDQLFSVSGGTYTDGMAFWRDRMNELLYYSGSPMLGLTTFVMTLGLAALVIGRRISGGGTA